MARLPPSKGRARVLPSLLPPHHQTSSTTTSSQHPFLPPSAPRITKPTPAGGLQHNHSTHSFQTPIQQPSQRPQFVPISSSRQPTPAHRFPFPSPRPAHNGERAETPHAEPPWVQ